LRLCGKMLPATSKNCRGPSASYALDQSGLVDEQDDRRTGARIFAT
jgi:hypothetical protein